MDPKDISLEDLEKFYKEFKEAEQKRTGLPPVGMVRPGLYHIGGGCYTGEGGWNEFCKVLQQTGKDILKDNKL